MMNYHVADFIIRIKNASQAKRREVMLPYARLVQDIAKVLVKEGYLNDVREEEKEGKKILVATVRYEDRLPVITDVAILSKPSLRVYKKAKAMAAKRHGMGIEIISTSKGVMTGREAQEKSLGGELLFRIW